MHKGDGFSAKPFGKSLFYCQNVWSHNGPAGQFWLLESALSKGVFTWENSHRREFHTDMTFWFRIAFTWWLGYFTSRYLKVHFMLIKCTYDSKSRTLRMRYPFQSTGRMISHRNGCSFRVYMIPLRDFVPEWNSRPHTRTGVKSRRDDSHQHEICGGIM